MRTATLIPAALFCLAPIVVAQQPGGEDLRQEIRRIVREEIRAALKEVHAEEASKAHEGHGQPEKAARVVQGFPIEVHGHEAQDGHAEHFKVFRMDGKGGMQTLKLAPSAQPMKVQQRKVEAMKLEDLDGLPMKLEWKMLDTKDGATARKLGDKDVKAFTWKTISGEPHVYKVQSTTAAPVEVKVEAECCEGAKEAAAECCEAPKAGAAECTECVVEAEPQAEAKAKKSAKKQKKDKKKKDKQDKEPKVIELKLGENPEISKG